jgi:predicted ATPase/class 3 adenylate cyclase
VTELPTGTITFLFTDIEGSTRLVQQEPERWPGLLTRHFEILRDAIGRHEGVEFGTEGEAIFASFESAPQALAAAVEAQRELATEPWPPNAAIRVRMGIHTGVGMVSGGMYVGLDVHRAARITSAGHGGHILISGSTYSLVRDSLAEGVRLRDLGDHRLKDLSRPEQIWGVQIDGLEIDYAELATLNAVPNNLPVQLTSFLGRERELEEARQLLIDGRLVTLTGPGGTGKTRLSLQIAASALERFPDGIYFVALGPISQPDLVLPTIGQVVGLVEPGLKPMDRLAEHIGERCLLLVLDNFEQVGAAAPQIAELLLRAPRASILVTSRSPLRVYGEREYPVPPLKVPDPRHLPDLEQLSAYESVALFVERAMAVRPEFSITSANAPAVAEICARLDGLPLAIELAAARVRVLSPMAIMERLGDRLALLSSGARNLPERQQTLRGAIDWSYDLLNEADRRVFTRFAVFAGGATLEAVEAVVLEPDEKTDALDAMASLVDKSLVRQETQPDGEPRFRMLETIREYAMERLAESDEIEPLRERHAEWVIVTVEHLANEVFGDRQRETLDGFELEHDNIRAALEWTLARGRSEQAMRIFASSWRFWQMRGYLAEAREQAERVFKAGAAVTPAVRERALEAAGGIAYWQADMPAARAWYSEALDLARASGDDARIANALYNLSFTYTITSEGVWTTAEVDIERARAISEEAADIYRRLGDEAGLARTLWALANVQYFGKDFARGVRFADEALEIFRRRGDRFMIAWTLYMMALYQLRQNPVASRASLEEALPIFIGADDKSGFALIFDAFATLDWADGDVERALRLAGYAAAQERLSGTGLARANRDFAGFSPERLTAEDPSLAARYTEGQRLTLEEATDLALHRDPTAARSGKTSRPAD